MKKITEMVHRNTSKVYIFAKVTAVITVHMLISFYKFYY